MRRRDQSAVSLGIVLGLLGCGAPPGGGLEAGDGTEDESTTESAGDGDGDGDGEDWPPNQPPFGELGDPCQGVDCSGHGACVAVGQLARCECEPGFLAKREECIACTPIGEDRVLDVDVPVITVEPQVSFAGGLISGEGFAEIILRSDLDSVSVADLSKGVEPLSLVPGNYDAQFARHTHFDQDDPLPDNRDAFIEFGRSIIADGALAIDVPVVTVSAELEVNGLTPMPLLSHDWLLQLVEPADGHALEFDEIDELRRLDIIPGVYDLSFTGAGHRQPDNNEVLVRDDAFIAKSGHIVVDVPMIDHGGILTVDGQVLGVELDDRPYVYLQSPTLGSVFVGDAALGGEFMARLIPGTYDVVYDIQKIYNLAPQLDGVPDNEHAILPGALVITQDGGTTDVDIPIVTRSGALTLDGVPVAANEWGASLYYVNRDTEDRVYINDLAWGEYSIELIPGVYDLLYDVYEPRPVLPSNGKALIATGIVIDESGTFDIDVSTITMTGSITVNGQAFGQPEEARLFFVEREIGQVGRVLVADVSAGSYSVKMIPGTYDVVYDTWGSYWEHPPGLPSNVNGLVAAQVAMIESGSFDVDIPMVEITGLVTLAGEAVPGGEIWLYPPGIWAGARVATTGVPYSALLMPGTYEVTYKQSESGPGIPRNRRATLACVVIE